MGAVINGIKGANIGPEIYGQNETGAYTIDRYTGTRAEVRQMIPLVIAAGGWYEIEESWTGAADKLTARYPVNFGQAEQPVNDWEIFAQEVEKDVLETDIAVVVALSAEDKRRIRNSIDGLVDQSPALTGGPTGAATNLYLEMVAGVRSKRILVPTLRHTITVSTLYALNSNIAAAGALLKTATLAGFGIPASVANQMPVPANYTVTFGDGTVKNYGWYVKYPTVRKALYQRVQLVQEYEYGLWSLLLYGAPA